MPVWDTRHHAELDLADALRDEADSLQGLLDSIERCAARCWSVDSHFGRVSALVVTKGRNLAAACYSLSLDGLAQESGAVLRPLIEAIELLKYLRTDPSRVDEATDGRLPRAGEIAKRIDGDFQELRMHLNSSASHLSVSFEALRHVLDIGAGAVRTVQPHNRAVLRRNLHTLLLFMSFLAVESVNCVSVAEGAVDANLADHVEAQKQRAFGIASSGTAPN